MKDTALNALDAAVRRGISYADVRLIETEDRNVSTKNGKIGQASSSVSQGLGIRVLDRGSWGFAATDDLTAGGIEAAAALAVEIARASALAKKHDVALAPEQKYEIWRKSTTLLSRPSRSMKSSGRRPFASILFPFPWIATWSCCSP